MDYKYINKDFIIDYCKAHKEAATWLKGFALVEGKKPTFLQIKIAFVKQFMPEIAPKAKPKEKSIYDIIAEL